MSKFDETEYRRTYYHNYHHSNKMWGGYWVDARRGIYPRNDIQVVMITDKNGKIQLVFKTTDEDWEDKFPKDYLAWRLFPEPYRRKEE